MNHPHILGVGALLLSVLGASCSSTKEDYLAKGDRFQAAGRIDDAEICYRKALQKDPAFGLAYFRLGLLQLSKKDPAAAYQSLNSANNYLPNNQDVKVKLADLLLGAYIADAKRPQNLYVRVSHLAAELLSANTDSFDGLRIQGTLAALGHRSQEALALLQRADGLKPGNPDVILPLAGVLAETGQEQQSEEMVRALIAKDGTVTRAYDFLFVRYIQTGRAEDATQILKLKADNNPNSSRWLVDLAHRYILLGQEAQARSTLDKLSSDSKRFPDGHLIAGRYYLDIARMAEALEQFQVGLKQDTPRQAAYRRGIAAALRGMGKLDDALLTIKDVLAQNPADLEAQELNAAILAQKGDLDGALAVYQNIVKSKEKTSALHFEYGRLLALKRDPKAIGEFQDAARLAPASTVPRLALVEEYIRRGRFGEAVQTAEEALAIQPGEPRGRLLHAIALAGQGMRDLARTEFIQLAKESTLSGEAGFQLAILDIGDHRFAEARQILEKLYKPGMTDLRPLRGLLTISVNERQFQDAIRLLQNEIRNRPTDELRYLLAEADISSGKLDEGIAILEQLRASAPRSQALVFRLGELYQNKGDMPKALSSYQQASSINPKDPVSYGLVAYAYQNMGNRAAAISSYRQSVKYETNTPEIFNNLAYLLAEGDQNLDEALQLAQRAVKADPGSSNFADTLGWVYVKKNDPSTAVQILQNASRRDPGQPLVHYHLAAALLKAGNKARAEEELNTALAQHPTPEDEQKIRMLKVAAGNQASR